MNTVETDGRTLAAMRRMYQSDDMESARLRAAHLREVIRLSPYTMAANAGSALVAVWALGTAAGWARWLWLGGLLAYCLLALLQWWRFRRSRRDTISRATMRRTTVQAAVLAGLWCALIVTWFPGAAPGQQLVLVALTTGMLGAGSFVLSPLPLASGVYATVFASGALAALLRDGRPAAQALVLMLAIYAPMVVVGSVAAWRKSTALIKAQARSARQENLLAMLLQDFEQQAGEALWEVSAEGWLRYHSPRLRELLGLAQEVDLDVSLPELAARHSPEGAPLLRRALAGGRPFRELVLPWEQGGELRHLGFSGKRLFDESGRCTGWRGVVADLSEKVRSESLLRRMAHTDSLTGLANRFVLREALAGALEHGRSLALLSIDLDHFKAVNDSHGHSAGDELLCVVAERLRTCVRPSDLVARLGGDEFAILMLEPGADEAAARLAQRVIEVLTEAIEIGTRRVRVGASVGVALCEAGRIGVDDLLVQSDMALYAAKEAGRGRHVRYDAAMGEYSHRRMAIESGLRTALRQGGLALHWQAKVHVARWQLSGAEALLRWVHPTLGPIGPAEFVGVAEDCGLIDELGRWVLAEACRCAVHRLPGLVISVNVSAMQLRDEGFVEHVREVLSETGLPPAQLELEITESFFIGNSDAALERLHALRDLGLRIGLDDFGTGYSSLSYLRRFPFDTLKIDRAFVSEVLQGKDALAIVQMIAQLAGTLGMSTVCEGVETEEQLRVVTAAGCEQVQGHGVARPGPVDELVALRASWARTAARASA